MEADDFFKRCDEFIRVFGRPEAKDSEKLLKLARAAKKYIDNCPCDPDIYPEQLEAWNEYEEALNKLT